MDEPFDVTKQDGGTTDVSTDVASNTSGVLSLWLALVRQVEVGLRSGVPIHAEAMAHVRGGPGIPLREGDVDPAEFPLTSGYMRAVEAAPVVAEGE